MSVSSGDAYQQEVDFLRGQIGTLDVVGLWTSATPPKWTGVYGIALEFLEAGESLIRAFVRLHEASEADRTTAKAILTLVQQYEARVSKIA